MYLLLIMINTPKYLSNLIWTEKYDGWALKILLLFTMKQYMYMCLAIPMYLLFVMLNTPNDRSNLI